MVGWLDGGLIACLVSGLVGWLVAVVVYNKILKLLLSML